MKFAVDKIETDIVVLEEIENGELRSENVSNLPEGIKEGDILKYENCTYFLDNDEKLKRINRINEKMRMLKEMARK